MVLVKVTLASDAEEAEDVALEDAAEDVGSDSEGFRDEAGVVEEDFDEEDFDDVEDFDDEEDAPDSDDEPESVLSGSLSLSPLSADEIAALVFPEEAVTEDTPSALSPQAAIWSNRPPSRAKLRTRSMFFIDLTLKQSNKIG